MLFRSSPSIRRSYTLSFHSSPCSKCASLAVWVAELSLRVGCAIGVFPAALLADILKGFECDGGSSLPVFNVPLVASIGSMPSLCGFNAVRMEALKPSRIIENSSAAMPSRVLALWHSLKIVGPIVPSVFVLMVDIVAGRNLAVEVFPNCDV